MGQRAFLEMMAGRPENAFQYLDRAIALDPRGPAVADHLGFECRANLTLGRYAEAVQSCEKSLARRDDWIPYLYLVAAHTQLGDRERAAAAKDKLLRHQPGMSIARLKAAAFRTMRTSWGGSRRTSSSRCARPGCPSSRRSSAATESCRPRSGCTRN